MTASDRPGQAAAAIEALGESPSPSDARRELAEFDAKDLAAALVSRGGGGSSPVTGRAVYVGNVLEIANEDLDPLPWSTLSTGDPLLDITDPAAPTIVTAGIYGITCTIAATEALTAGGTFRINLNIDNPGIDGASARQIATRTDPLQLDALASASLSFYCVAGATVTVEVTNADGANAIDFQLLYGVVQRIT